LRARIAVDLDVAVGPWMVGFAIETPVGQRVYHVNTHTSGVDLKGTPGRHVVELSLPDLRLGAGRYVVRVGIGQVEGEMIDSNAQAAVFDVSASGLGNGVVDVETTITLSR